MPKAATREVHLRCVGKPVAMELVFYCWEEGGNSPPSPLINSKFPCGNFKLSDPRQNQRFWWVSTKVWCVGAAYIDSHMDFLGKKWDLINAEGTSPSFLCCPVFNINSKLYRFALAGHTLIFREAKMGGWKNQPLFLPADFKPVTSACRESEPLAFLFKGDLSLVPLVWLRRVFAEGWTWRTTWSMTTLPSSKEWNLSRTQLLWASQSMFFAFLCHAPMLYENLGTGWSWLDNDLIISVYYLFFLCVGGARL